jgi:DNA repair exonuclease SbcCD ATPase subunit
MERGSGPVRLRDLHLEGFGRLVARTFQFAPGLNLVHGPNEAGKSTLMRAMIAMLYSFFEEGTITAAKRAAMMSYQPWDESARYAGELRYALDDGSEYRVRRVFAPRSSTALFALPEEVDISEEFDKATRGRLFFADVQLGLSKEVYESVCQITLSDLATRDLSAAGITATLMRLATSAATDSISTDAIERLERVIREDIGTPRAQSRPLPQHEARLATLQEEREAAATARKALYAHTARLREAEARLLQVERERQAFAYLQALAEYEERERQAQAIARAEEEVAALRARREALERWATFPAHLHADVLRLSARLQELTAAHEEAPARIAEVRERLTELEEALVAADKRVGALEHARETPLDVLPDVQDLADAWRQAEETYRSALMSYERAREVVDRTGEHVATEAEQLAPAIAMGHVGLATLEQRWLLAREQVVSAEERFAEAEAEWARVGMTEERYRYLESVVRAAAAGEEVALPERQGCLPAIAQALRLALGRPQPVEAPITGLPPEVLIAAQVGPLHAGLERARAEVERARAALTAVRGEATASLGSLLPAKEPGPEALASLAERLEVFLKARADVEHHRALVHSLREDLDVVRARRDVAAGDLLDALAEAGFGGDDAATVLETYLAQVERRRALEREERERTRLRAAVRDMRGEIARWEQREEAAATARTTLRALLEEAGLSVGEDMAAVARFEEGVQQHAAWAEAHAASEAAERSLATLTAGGSPAEREAAQARCAARLEALRRAHPTFGDLAAEESADAYAARGVAATEEADALREELVTLRGAIERATAVAERLVALDEEIAIVSAEVRRLTAFRDAATLAQQELAAAAEEYQRRFAPQLEPILKQSLARVTRGRYVDAQVDPETLAVTLVAPELGRPVPVDLLSAGTGDLVYLMLRMAIAQAISGNRERLPLFLDDPLAQCDQERQAQVLEYLALLSEQTQIFLFTKDAFARAWFETTLAGQEAHALHLLA